MVQKFYTVGMAGHIDHGKTTLTKALTGVETDRLKEEQQRGISIEPGFAPLVQTEDVQISIIDVPGHERFIRQMIAGVVGIDVVVLVIAADEGVMPQTREHLQILSLLGIERGVIAVSKLDEVEADFLEVVEADIGEAVTGTFLEKAPTYFVDSISGRGIDSFKEALISFVQASEKRSTFPSFRLPIDHVFTVKGQGVVVRGTIFDGHVRVGDGLTVLPSRKQVRVRQIQSHHEQKKIVYADQRAALNVGGIAHEEVNRGDVLVKDDFYTPTSRIDVAFTSLGTTKHPIKQRQLIKLYVGTSEVTGKVIFYDRNELGVGEAEEVLCQLQLDEAIVVTRGDRFIIRRATPIETLGGGWVMDSNGKQRRFGEQSVELLQQIKNGTAEERVLTLLQAEYAHTKDQILRLASVTEDEFAEIDEQLISIGKQMYTKQSILLQVTEGIKEKLKVFHKSHPLRLGMNKAELVSAFTISYPVELIEFVLASDEAADEIEVVEDSVSLASFTPTYPVGWQRRIDHMLEEWEASSANVEKMVDYFIRHEIDESLHQDLYYFLLQTNRAYEFDDGRLIARSVVLEMQEKLYKKTAGNPFTLQIARDVLGLSRKNLVALLELFDRLQFTERKGNERIWL